MKTAGERPILYAPMKTPRSWHVVYQPDYRTLNVFNLHERGMFRRGKALYREWLIKSNISWIQPFIPRMIHDFRYDLYQRVTDTLYTDYRKRGGDESEKELIKKINLFIRIYESDGLIKPNGASWLSEDELWDCWAAFSGSESEATRVCSTIENVLIPLREKLRKELGTQDK